MSKKANDNVEVQAGSDTHVDEHGLMSYIDQASDFIQRVSEHLHLSWAEHVNVKHRLSAARHELNEARIECQKCKERLDDERRDAVRALNTK